MIGRGRGRGAALVVAVLSVLGVLVPAGGPAAAVGPLQPSVPRVGEVITTVAGTGAGSGAVPAGRVATNTPFSQPWAVGDHAGNLFTSESAPCRLRKIDLAGLVTELGGGTCGNSGDGGPAQSAAFSMPRGLALAMDHSVAPPVAKDLYVADTGNCTVRKIALDTNVVTRVAGAAPGTPSPCTLAGDGGPATSAKLNLPGALALDASGALYIADSSNCRVRKVTGGTITTVAGTTCGFAGDGGPATSAQLRQVQGVGIDPYGRLLIADTPNNRIRRVTDPGTPGAIIQTIAGSTAGSSGDGGAALSAKLNGPAGISSDARGTLFIADYYNCKVRRIDAAGMITTRAGSTCGDDAGRRVAGGSRLQPVSNVSVTPGGDVLIGDTTSNKLRLLDRAGAPVTDQVTQYSPGVYDFRTYGNSNTGSNWTGGDGTYSVQLPDNRVAWLFNDSFANVSGAPGPGTVLSTHARDGGRLLANQLVIEDRSSTPPTFTTEWRGGVEGSDYFPAPATQRYWPLGSTLRTDGKLQVILKVWQEDATKLFGGYEVGMASAVVDPSDFEAAPVITPLPDAFPGTNTTDPAGCGPVVYGAWITPVPTPGFDKTYIYGTETCGSGVDQRKYLHVAQAAGLDGADTGTGSWLYYRGMYGASPIWSKGAGAGFDPNGRIPMGDGSDKGFFGDEMSVVRIGNTYRAVSSADSITASIQVFESTNPRGPFTRVLSPRVPAADDFSFPPLLPTVTGGAYLAPEFAQPTYNGTPNCQMFPYNAKEHPDLSTDREMVVGYNVNTLCPGDLLLNVDTYRSRFIRIPIVNVPGKPTGVVGTPGMGAASVSWTAPADDGGALVTSYSVTARVGATVVATRVVPAWATTATFIGLAAGVDHTFTVVAHNHVGDGLSSTASGLVRPT